MLTDQPALRDAARSSPLFDKLKAGSKKVGVDGEQFHVLEGDLLLDEDELMVYALQRQTLNDAFRLELTATTTEPGTAALVGTTRAGKIIRWKEGLELSYRVAKDTLSADEYDLVRTSMTGATRDWESVCGVKFVHRQNLDGEAGTGTAGCLFTVRGLDAQGQFIASAFFPSDPSSRRRVLIDPSYFDSNLGFDKAGVLRHELGHVLGFRHEHIRSGAPPGCPDEDLFGVINLTNYDPKSVMHYFCGGVGTRELRITAKDERGAQRLYGPPFDGFAFVD